MAVASVTALYSQTSEIEFLTKETFLQKVTDYTKSSEWQYKGSKPAVIDFYADWCGPCKQMSPVMEELAAKYKGKLDFYKINVDKETELAAMFGIRSIPYFVFIPMGEEPKAMMGSTPKENFENILRTYLLK
jgi:thioredoxin